VSSLKKFSLPREGPDRPVSPERRGKGGTKLSWRALLALAILVALVLAISSQGAGGLFGR